MMKIKPLSKSTKQISVPLEEITDLIKTSEGYSLLSRVFPLNVPMMADNSKNNMYKAIHSALMTIDANLLSVYIVNKVVDLQEPVSHQHDLLKNVKFDFEKPIIENNIINLKDFQEKKNTKQGAQNNLHFYVLFTTKDKDYNRALSELKRQSDAFNRELSASGLLSMQMKAFDTKRLIFDITSKESSQDTQTDESWRVSDVLPKSYKTLDKDNKHLLIGDAYYRHFYVSKFPLFVDNYSWFDRFLQFKSDFVIAMHFEYQLFDESYSKALTRTRVNHTLTSQMEKNDADKNRQKNIEMSLIETSNKLSDEAEKLFKVTTLIQLQDESMEVLNDKVSNLRKSTVGFNFSEIRHEKGREFIPFFASLPIGYRDNLINNLRWTLKSSDFASMLIFNSSDYIESDGIAIGTTLIPKEKTFELKGPIITNKANRRIHYNGHTAIVATTGAGKTTFLRTFVDGYVPYYDYNTLIDFKGDLFFPYGKRYKFSQMKYCVNPLHIFNVDKLSDEELVLKINDTIDNFVEYAYWFSEDMSQRKGNILKKDLREIFEKTRKSRELPIISDLINLLNEKVKNTDLTTEERTVRKNFIIDFEELYLGTMAPLINGQTNVEFSKFQVFDVSGLNRVVVPPIMDLVLKMTNNFIRSFGVYKPPKHHVVIDEAHNLSSKSNPFAILFLIEKYLKEIRGFGCDVTTATQNIVDYGKVEGGELVIGLSHFKIFFTVSSNDITEIEKLNLNLTESEYELIKEDESSNPQMLSNMDVSRKSRGIMFIGSRKIGIQKFLTKAEIEWALPEDFEKYYNERSRYLSLYEQQGLVINE